MTTLLQVEGISKAYPGVQALEDVSFAVEAGTIHAVMGENGAGKSTLMQIIAGAQRPSAGQLLLDGAVLAPAGVKDASARGISIVFQELMLAPNLSVAENIFLGVEKRLGGVFVDRGGLRAAAGAALSRLRIALDPDQILGTLTVAQQQLVEICKALVHEPRLLILDEPTSSLSEADAATLFRLLHELKCQGRTILYISHRMREVFDNCDAITVLRDGRHIRTARREDIEPQEVVRLMVGRDLEAAQRVPAPHASQPEVVLSVRGLSDRRRYRDVSFDLHAGEVVGMAGLIGAGRSETALGIFGAPPPRDGTIAVRGRGVRIGGPRAAMRLGIGLVPEDRKSQGLVLGLGVGRNLSMAALELGRATRAGFVRRVPEGRLIERYVQRFRIRTPRRQQPVGLLSGGNQQKVVLAKWLATDPAVLIVDEPTRGVDVGTKAEIYALLRELARGGLAILMISSDLPEILTVSDRVLVMREGSVVGELSGETATEEGVMQLASLNI